MSSLSPLSIGSRSRLSTPRGPLVGLVAVGLSLFFIVLALLVAMLEIGPPGAGFYLIVHSLAVVSLLAAFAGGRSFRRRFSVSEAGLFVLALGTLGWLAFCATRSDVPESSWRAAVLAVDGFLLACAVRRLAMVRPSMWLFSFSLGHLVALSALVVFSPGLLGLSSIGPALLVVAMTLCAALLGAGDRIGRARWSASVLIVAGASAVLVLALARSYQAGPENLDEARSDPSRNASLAQTARDEFLSHPIAGIGVGALGEHLRGRGLDRAGEASLVVRRSEKLAARNASILFGSFSTNPRALNSVSAFAVETGVVGFALSLALFLCVFMRGLFAALAERGSPRSISLLALLALWALLATHGVLSLSLASSYGLLAFFVVGGTIWGLSSRLGDRPEPVSAALSAPRESVRPNPVGFRNVAGWGVAAVVALVSIWIVAGPYRAERMLAAPSSDDAMGSADASGAFRRARSLAPYSAEVPYRHATHLRRGFQDRLNERGGWDESLVVEIVDAYRDAIRLNPYREEFYTSLIQFSAVLRRYDTMRQVLADAADYCPDSLTLTRWEARLAETAGDPELLERSLRRAVRLASASTSRLPTGPLFQLGLLVELRDLYDRLERPEKSRETRAQMALLFPDVAVRGFASQAPSSSSLSDLSLPALP
ncbi:hypothetical protein JW916_13975 [Candidatus Sumerlaeota bacterium]|nr:hypothetical protein [Candidatus Sumerlaeota bacterium]